MNVNCEQSPTGRHEIKFFGVGEYEDYSSWYECKYCDLDFEHSDAVTLRLLNAAMQLTADDAEEILDGTYDGIDHRDLWNYARTWRGE